MTMTKTADRDLPDLTDFLLDWKATCSVDLCRNTPEKDFALGTLDVKFYKLALQVRAPDRLKSASDCARCASGEDMAGETSDPLSAGEDPDRDPVEDDDHPDEENANASGGAGNGAGRHFAAFELPEDRLEEQAVPGAETDAMRNAAKPRGENRSDLSDIAEDIRSGNRRTRAFHLLELRLYDRQTINGKAFKNYLFEDVAKNGGSVGIVWGYLCKVMRDLVTDSFKKNIVAAPPSEGAPDSFDAAVLSPDSVDAARDRAAMEADDAEALDVLEKILDREWPRYDLAGKTALLFTVLDRPMNDEGLFRLVGVGRQALYNRRAIARDLLSELGRKGYDEDNFLHLLKGPFQDLLVRFARRDAACAPVLAFLAKFD